MLDFLNCLSVGAWDFIYEKKVCSLRLQSFESMLKVIALMRLSPIKLLSTQSLKDRHFD